MMSPTITKFVPSSLVTSHSHVSKYHKLIIIQKEYENNEKPKLNRYRIEWNDLEKEKRPTHES